MDRREFALSIATGAAVAAVGSRLSARGARGQPTPISALYSKAIVIDSLCAPVVDLESGPGADALVAVKQSGVTAVNFSVSIPDSEETLYNLSRVQRLIEDHPDAFSIVRRHSDIARCKSEQKLGIMLGFQYPTPLEEDLERINTYRNLGVRIMQLTYNGRSKFGSGCLDESDDGLTPAGRLAIATMNSAGVAVDLSHAGHRTTSQAIVASAKPVLISHAGCAAIYDHPRNQPDENLRTLADRGGYLGVYLMPYLVASPTVPTREHVLNHLLHAINVCGSDHVGIGSDGAIQGVVASPAGRTALEQSRAQRVSAGVSAPGEDRDPYVPDLNGPDRLEVIAGELARRGQPASVIEKILGANFQHVIGSIWGTDSLPKA
jgi:membrane dipeptidase